jgi:hypothetical protein
MILKTIGIIALFVIFAEFLPLILEIGHNCLGNA